MILTLLLGANVFDELENVVVYKGELDQVGEAILQRQMSSQPKEEQDIKDEKDLDDATLVGDIIDATLVHDEEAFNATLNDVKGESSSSNSTREPSTDMGASSTTGFDDASSTTTTTSMAYRNHIQLGVPPTDTEEDEDDSETDENEDARIAQPLRRFTGTVGLSRANANVSIYSQCIH